MGFLTPVLLGGAALVAAPILLHLAMRRKPREIEFPALRFVQQRQEVNRRRMRLRHLLLLALRCLLVVAVAAALARPTLKGAGLRGKEGAPLAVALVLDNSLRMQYISENRTRLEDAVNTAKRLIARLPEDSALAICELGRGVSGFAPDLSAGEVRLSNLAPVTSAMPLADLVVDAIELTAERADHRQEVMVFTDFAATALSPADTQLIADALVASPEVRIYFVDVGVPEPQQSHLGLPRIRRSVLRAGETLHLDADIVSDNGPSQMLVELYLHSGSGEPEKRGEQLTVMTGGAPGIVAFEVADLPLGIHQGMVKLPMADPLTFDNTRYFTVEIRPSAQVLLLAETPEGALMVRTALEALDQSFECTTKTLADFGSVEWENYDAVLLLDPPPLEADQWERISQFADGGGGVGLMLGHNATSRGMNEPAPQKLLPGTLKRISRDPTYLRPKRLDHPALAGLRNAAEGIAWLENDVWAFWQFDQLRADAYTVAEYANNQPAIVETPSSRGRVLTFTTPLSDPASPEGREPWNVLPQVPWPFVGICDQIASYLAQDAVQQLNYLAGETATISLGPRQHVTNYVLRMPDGQAFPRVAAGDEMLSLSTTDALGNYRVTAGAGRLDRGFSVNAPVELSDLTRVDPAEVLAALPPDRAQLATDLADAEEMVDVGRAGQELFPWAILLVAFVWGAEHLLANRFYRRAAEPQDKLK